MQTWLYHKTEPARIFDTDIDDLTVLHEAGWRDTPAALEDTSTDSQESEELTKKGRK